MEATLYLTDACNLRCSYCYQGNSKNESFLSEENLENALSYIVNNNIKDDKIDLTFLGGEPLLNKNALYKSIQIIRKKYSKYENLFHYRITTNGILMDDDIIHLLKKNRFNVSISIDGDMDTHNLNRVSLNKKDVYDVIIGNMGKMLNKGLDFSVRMTVTSNNVHFLYKNIKYFHNMGVKKINFIPDQTGEWTEESIIEFDKQLEKIDQFYLEETIKHDDCILNIHDYKLSVFIAKKKPAYCSGGSVGHLIINSKGDLYPCGYVTNNDIWKIGSVYTSLDRKKFLDTVKANVKKQSICHACDIGFTCSGAKCGFLNYVNTGCLNDFHEITCQLGRIIYKHNLYIIKELYERKHPRIMKLCDIAYKNFLEFSDIMKEIMGCYEEERQVV